MVYLPGVRERGGISEIYYMDKRTVSILLGVYKRESLNNTRRLTPVADR